MAVTAVGNCGEDGRADARVTITDGMTGVEINSTVMPMYGAAIRAQVDEVIQRFGSPSLHVLVEDSGALPFVIQARLEAALALHLQAPLPPIAARPAEGKARRLRRTRMYVPGNVPKFFPSTLR